MGFFDNAKKVPTGVPGLDDLLYDGLQLQNFNDSVEYSTDYPRNNEKGLIIMLRGARGIYKTRLAMQMLHGISKSIYSMDGFSKYASVPYLFSLNMTKENLSDMFLDYLITRQIDFIIRENASGMNTSWKHDILSKSLFAVDGCSEQHAVNINMPINLPNDYRSCMDKYLCERTIYYNNRTNALHFLRSCEGDTNANLLFHRRSDNLSDYWKDNKRMLRFLPSEMRDDFFDVRFNEGLSGETFQNSNHPLYPHSARLKFQKILDCLDKIETENSDRNEDMKGHGEEKYIPCIVLDGFTQLGSDELERLSFPHIEKVLRRLSMVSILIFDERAKNLSCNADIVIDMKKQEYRKEDYVFHELQISKSSFQHVAFGWHKYKVRNCGIEVYPSIHRLLQHRNYMSHILTNTHADILHESYERFMKTELLKDMDVSEPDLSYETYKLGKGNREMELLKEMYRKGAEARMRLTNQHDNLVNGYVRELLTCLLLGGTIKSPSSKQCCEENDGNMHAIGNSSRWREYQPVTALIGNPNSFKRFLGTASTFRAAKNKEHTLVILFDKEEDEMRRQFICPGFSVVRDMPYCMDIWDNGNTQDTKKCNYEKQSVRFHNRQCSSCSNKCKLKECCHNCYKYIHFLNVRMGCVSAEELFSVLKRQIDIQYTDGNKFKKVKRIVIDDLQKIDYSFPFLRDERLFLTALVTLCRENNVELQFLCDKNAGLTQELCSLADNVICIQKDEQDLNSMILYVERFSEHVTASEILKCSISNVSELFYCDGEDLLLNIKSPVPDQNKNKGQTVTVNDIHQDIKPIVKYSWIGSMKSYWRQKITVNRDSDLCGKNEQYRR